MLHDTTSVLGHGGRYQTFNTIRERFTWAGMSRDIREWINSCHHCLSRKRVAPRHRRYNIYEETMAPMNRIAVDMVGPLPKTKNGNTHVMTIFCPFSHWPEAYALSSTTAKDVISCLKRHIAIHAVPSEVLSDRGTNFMAQKVHDFLAKVGCRKTQTTAYKPSSNGSVEGFHSYLAKALTAVVDVDHKDWDEHLDSVLFAYRVTPMDEIGFSPFEIIYGRKPSLPADIVLGREVADPPVDSPESHRQMVADAAQRNFAVVRQQRADRFSRNQKSDGNIENRRFYTNDKVYIAYPKGRFRPIGGATKLARLNDGPYTVLGTFDDSRADLVWRVRHDGTGYTSNVFVGRMIPCNERVPPEQDPKLPEALRAIVQPQQQADVVESGLNPQAFPNQFVSLDGAQEANSGATMEEQRISSNTDEVIPRDRSPKRQRTTNRQTTNAVPIVDLTEPDTMEDSNPSMRLTQAEGAAPRTRKRKERATTTTTNETTFRQPYTTTAKSRAARNAARNERNKILIMIRDYEKEVWRRW